MLPASWKPKNASGLIRIGPNEDGGYVIPEILLAKTKLLVGLGVNDDWRFEVDYKKRSHCEVVCYDHTVNAKFWRRRFKKDFAHFLLLRKLKPKKFIEMFRYFSYKTFFNGKNATHHKVMVGYDIPGQTSIDGIMQAYQDKNNVFFKIDIEGAEYRVIDQLNNHVDRIVGFAIELHDIDVHRNRITDFISQSNNYELVHIHANNVKTNVDDKGDPIAVEMTFLRKDLYKYHQQEEVTYPIAGLDYPNSPRDQDIVLTFESR